MISLELLHQQQLLRDLPSDLLEEIRRHIKMQEFPRRSFVIHRGSAGDALMMLFTGRLQVISMTEEGKEVGINFIEPGECFGEISLIDGGPRSASVIAVTNSVVGFLPKPQALWLFRNNPLIAERIQLRLCNMIRKEIQYRSNQGGAKAYTRIYSVIFGNQQIPAPKPGEPPPAIENLPSQQSIASMANVSRETVSRAIHALIKSGVIQKDTRRIIVNDVALLEKLAKGEILPQDLSITHSNSTPLQQRPITPAVQPAREHSPVVIRRPTATLPDS